MGNQLCPVITVYTPADLSPEMREDEVIRDVIGLRPRNAEKSATVGGVEWNIVSRDELREDGKDSFETADEVKK